MNFENKYIDELIDDRKYARLNKDWKLSDGIRNYLDSKRVFIFDTPHGQEVYYMPEKYFKNKPDSVNNREFVKQKIQTDIRSNAVFDAWLFSINSSSKIA